MDGAGQIARTHQRNIPARGIGDRLVVVELAGTNSAKLENVFRTKNDDILIPVPYLGSLRPLCLRLERS